MKCIGIDQNMHEVYETTGSVWYPVWPDRPVISAAAFVKPEERSLIFHADLYQAKMVFREDSFDPVTRIRRGRFYISEDIPSLKWTLPHPVYRYLGSSRQQGDFCERKLFVFCQLQQCPSQRLVAIGSSDSLWRIVGIEKIITGEYLVTLKARYALGTLPELNPESIPEKGREKAKETFEKLSESAYRETPSSIIDRARDVAQWFLATWLADKEDNSSFLIKDLGELVKNIKDQKHLIASAADCIRLLHARGKPNEQEKRNVQPPMEADAEFALAAIGLMLRELGWTKAS